MIPNYSRILEVSRQAIRDFDETGVAVEKAEPIIGNMLMRLGHSYLALDEPANAAKAFGQYIQKYPKGPYAASAQYFLAESLDRQGQPEQALENFEDLATDGVQFWSKSANDTAEQLRWENERPYLGKESE